MPLCMQCLSSESSENCAYSANGGDNLSSESRESSVSTVSSASSVNSANSVSSLGGGATSVSNVIFTFRSIITQVADMWRKQEENQAKVGFTNYSATDGQPSHTLLLGTIVAFHFSDH